METNEMIEKLKKTLTHDRFVHSLNVMRVSAELAEHYHIDKESAAVAGLLHDCAKCVSKGRIFELCSKYSISTDEITLIYPGLLHGPVGAVLAKRDYDVNDERILEAIKVHTTGSVNMTLLQKIIFIADLIEPNRCFEGIEKIRKEVLVDLDKALIMAFDRTISYITKKSILIHPDTIMARNHIIISKYYSE